MQIDQLLQSIQQLSAAERASVLNALNGRDQEMSAPIDFAARIQREVPNWDADEYRRYRDANVA